MSTKIRPFNLHTSVDSHVKGLIDSDYIQARQTAGTDSSSTQAMIDSNLNNDITFGGDVTFDSAGAIVFDKSDQALEFSDNYRAKFGTSGGMQLYHTGSFGFIETNFVQVKNGGGVVAAQFFPGSSSRLHFNNTTRIETTDSGSTVTGNIAANIRSNPKSMSLAHTVDSNSNALLVGPINVDSGVTITVNGTLMVV